MMPKGMTVKIKGTNLSTMMEGGTVDGMEMLHRDGQPAVRINRKDKTYSKIPEAPEGKQPEVTVVKTSETAKIVGYTCQKYQVTIKDQGQSITQFMWTTSEIKDVDMKAMARQRNTQGRPIFYEKVEGFPLRIEVSVPQGSVMMEVQELKREKLLDSQFSIPEGFKEVN